jgi:hypothetical protein
MSMFVERPLFPPSELRNVVRLLDLNEMIGQLFPAKVLMDDARRVCESQVARGAGSFN